MGWSQGGVTAFHMAAQYPENIEKLIAFGTFARIDDKFFENRGKCGTFTTRILLEVTSAAK